MNVKRRVIVIDQYVVEGKIIEAIDTFFHPDVHTQESDGQETHGISETKNKLRTFLQKIERFNEVVLHSQTLGPDTTMSEYTFDMTSKDGSRIVWKEVIRRKWLDGLVIDERYYTATTTNLKNDKT